MHAKNCRQSKAINDTPTLAFKILKTMTTFLSRILGILTHRAASDVEAKQNNLHYT